MTKEKDKVKLTKAQAAMRERLVNDGKIKGPTGRGSAAFWQNASIFIDLGEAVRKGDVLVLRAGGRAVNDTDPDDNPVPSKRKPPRHAERLGVRRDHLLKFRCTEEEHETVMAQARARKMDASAILRDALDHYKRKAQIEEARALTAKLLPMAPQGPLMEGIARVFTLLGGGV